MCDSKWITGFLPYFITTYETGEVEWDGKVFEMPLLHASGRQAWFRVTVSVDRGDPSGFRAVARSISPDVCFASSLQSSLSFGASLDGRESPLSVSLGEDAPMGWSLLTIESIVEATVGSSNAPGPAAKAGWSAEEDEIIMRAVSKIGTIWRKIALMLPPLNDRGDRRTNHAVRNRWLRLEKRKDKEPAVCDIPLLGAAPASADRGGDMWSPQEDKAIDEGVRDGLCWKAIAATLCGRSASSCRSRWLRERKRQLAAMGVAAKNAGEIFAESRRIGLHLPDRSDKKAGAAASGPPSKALIPTPVAIDTAVTLSKSTGSLSQIAEYMTRLLALGCSGKPLTDRYSLLFAVHVVIDVAEAQDCHGLNAFAMQSACQLGFPLSAVKPKEGPITCSSPLRVAVPNAVSDLFYSPCMVSVRTLSGSNLEARRLVDDVLGMHDGAGAQQGPTPNQHFAEYVTALGGDGIPDLWSKPGKLLELFFDNVPDRQRFARLFSEALSAPLTPIDSLCKVGQTQADSPFMLALKRDSKYVHALSALGVPLSPGDDDSEVVVPHTAFIRRCVTSAATFVVHVLSPFGPGGAGRFDFEIDSLVQRKRLRRPSIERAYDEPGTDRTALGSKAARVDSSGNTCTPPLRTDVTLMA